MPGLLSGACCDSVRVPPTYQNTCLEQLHAPQSAKAGALTCDTHICIVLSAAAKLCIVSVLLSQQPASSTQRGAQAGGL